MAGTKQVSLCPAPVFDGTYYATWRRRLKEYFLCIYMNSSLWNLVTANKFSGWPNGSYDYPRAKSILTSALSKGELAKVGTCISANDIWEKLQAIYGNPHVTRATLALLESQFDRFTMKPKETISEMYSRFMETIITPMFDLGRIVTDREQVNKILSILPRKFERDMTAFKEQNDVNAMNSAQLIGFLISCEIMFKVAGNDEEEMVKGEGA